MNATDPVPGLMVTVPLARGGFGAAMIARSAPVLKKKFRLVLLYSFNRIFNASPTPDDVCGLPITDAINLTLCGDISIRDKRWATIGIRPGFDLAHWPVPPQIQPGVSPRYSMIPDPSVARVCLTDDVYLSSLVVENRGLIDPEQESHFPYAIGLGDRSYLETALDRAIRDGDRLRSVLIDAGTVELWNSVIEKAKRSGVFPSSVPWGSRRKNESDT